MFVIDGPHIRLSLTSFSSMAMDFWLIQLPLMIMMSLLIDSVCLLIDGDDDVLMNMMSLSWFVIDMRIDLCRLMGWMYSAFTEVFIQRQHTQCPSLCLMEGETHYICFRYVVCICISYSVYLCLYIFVFLCIFVDI